MICSGAGGGTLGLLLVVFLAPACGAANDRPPPAADAEGADHPIAADAGGETPTTEVGGGDRSAATDGGGGAVVNPNLACNPVSQDLWKWSGMTADGQVRWTLNRCARNVCAGGCDIYEVYFALTYSGRTDAARGGDIAYTRTHHNWHDDLIATLPDRVLKWRIVVDEGAPMFQPRYFVSIETPAGVPILPETETGAGPCVPPTGCGG